MNVEEVSETSGGSDSSDRRTEAREMATALACVFRAHDRGHRERALEACRRVDERQFSDLDSEAVDIASEAFIDALWAKDDVEFRCLNDGEIDPERVRNADYSEVATHLRKRAAVVGADQRYATEKLEAWRQHKAGGDYWSPYQRAQMYEFRAAIDDPEYPRKERGGRSGPGPSRCGTFSLRSYTI